MAKQSKNVDNQYVRKETFWLVALLALAVGFFAGVMFAIFKSDSGVVPGQPQAQMPQTQSPQPQAVDPGRLSMIATLEKETQANPTNEKAWIELGNSYFDTGQYEKSIQAYRKALEINPNNANVWTDMGYGRRHQSLGRAVGSKSHRHVTHRPIHRPNGPADEEAAPRTG
jgi:cytochrome c-type biogenesis protein CcmH/NrfG